MAPLARRADKGRVKGRVLYVAPPGTVKPRWRVRSPHFLVLVVL